MNTPKTITEAGFLAMVDFAAQPGNETALSNNKCSSLGEHMENRIVQALLERLDLPATLERVKHGHYSSNISLVAWHTSRQGLKKLHELKEHLKATYAEWPYPNTTMREFSDTYWHIVSQGRIKRGNFRRAFDDIRKMTSEEAPFKPSLNRVERALRDLRNAMQEKRVLPFEHTYGGTNHFRQTTPMAGLKLVLALYPNSTILRGIDSREQPHSLAPGRYEFTFDESLILELAEHFANERKKKRARATARA